VAAQLGVSQPTVSRRLDRGVERLRAALRRRGVACGAGLVGLLAANAAGAAPPPVVAALGKLAASGVGAGAAAAAARGPLARLARPGAAVAAAVLAVGALYVTAPRPADPPAEEAPPAWPAGPVRGKAFCPVCAAPLLQGRRPAEGIFIHRDGDADVVYDLRLPGPVPDFHKRFCDASRKSPEAVEAEGTTETRDGRRVFAATRLDLAPK
jgi:hypothetical protein